MSWFDNIAKKKLAGIPVLYIALAVVLILAFFAWRMRGNDSASIEETEIDEFAGLGQTEFMEAEVNPYVPSNTVLVQQPANTGVVTYESNDAWLSAAITWLIQNLNITTGVAQTAVMAYLDGRDMTMTQANYIDAVVRAIGLPPYPNYIGAITPDRAATPPKYTPVTATPSTGGAVVKGGGGGKTYTVQFGDTLSGIASRYGGNWQDLYAANKKMIDDSAKRRGLSAPYYNHIISGQKLKLPSGW